MQDEKYEDYKRDLHYNGITDCFALFTRSLTLQRDLKEVLHYAKYSKNAFLGRCLFGIALHRTRFSCVGVLCIAVYRTRSPCVDAYASLSAQNTLSLCGLFLWSTSKNAKLATHTSPDQVLRPGSSIINLCSQLDISPNTKTRLISLAETPAIGRSLR